VYKLLIPKLNGQHSYTNQASAVIKSACKIHGTTLKGENYFLFENLLKAKHQSIAGYSEEQVKVMMKATFHTPDLNFSLHKLIVLLTYTGARVSSVAGVKLTEFKEVPLIKDVYYRMVTGKGKGNGYPYPIFISKNTLDYLYQCCKEGHDELTSWSTTQKSSFSNYSRSMLIHKLRAYRQLTNDDNEKKILDELSIGTAIFHSLRKYFSVRLANEEHMKNDSDTLSMLLGQKPNTLAYKVYVLSDGQKFENVLNRMAKAYAGSSFMNLELWK
jgi:site-specific recombinase XerD